MGSTKVHMPAQPSYGQSLRESMQAQIDLGGDLYKAEAEYRPKYAELETSILGKTLLGDEGGEAYFHHGDRGLLDLMGSPRFDYTTGRATGVQGGTDSATQAFQAGYGRQQPRGRGAGGKTDVSLPPASLGGTQASPQQYIGEGQDRRVRRGGVDHRVTAETERDPLSPYSQMQRYITTGPRPEYEADVTSPVTSSVGIETRDRKPVGDPHWWTGERDFGGMAQYGADLAEYGAARQRAADIRDVGAFGQAATRALRQADPLSEAMLGRMAGIAGEEMAGAAQNRFSDPLMQEMRGQAGSELVGGQYGYGGLLGMMGDQAREDLAARDTLTARERGRAVQEARQAMEARGRLLDPLSAVSELESLENARRARRMERRGFAQNVMAAEEARKAQGRQYAANLLQMEAARRGEARGYGQQVLGTSRAMTADPFMAILGRPSGASQQIAQQGLGAAQYGLSAGPGVVFNPEAGLSYMLGQQGQQAGLAAAQAGSRGSMMGGLLGAAGQLGSAAIMSCWVAREVYGESNPKWKQFRHWMLNKSPDWFREWYLINGESVAEHIKDKPEMKAQIKIFMDSKLEA